MNTVARCAGLVWAGGGFGLKKLAFPFALGFVSAALNCLRFMLLRLLARLLYLPRDVPEKAEGFPVGALTITRRATCLL